MLRDACGRDERVAHAHERRRIAGRRNDDTTRSSFVTETVFDELDDLATTLADETHDEHVGL